jgi:hypothetical protein
MADWVFQANPQRFDFHASIRRSRDGQWTTPRYRNAIAVGDRVWLAVVGHQAPGVYYVATVTSRAYEVERDEFGRWQTDIHYDYRLTPPLLRHEIRLDPLLHGCWALRGFRGSNMPLAENHAEALWELAEDRLEKL